MRRNLGALILEDIVCMNMDKLKERMGELDESAMNKVDSALSVSFGLSGNN